MMVLPKAFLKIFFLDHPYLNPGEQLQQRARNSLSIGYFPVSSPEMSSTVDRSPLILPSQEELHNHLVIKYLQNKTTQSVFNLLIGLKFTLNRCDNHLIVGSTNLRAHYLFNYDATINGIC
uniref:Uncharacterized protein n=1 Tax=Micrurus paraensis TaxID=1970185 RepID=A0A2D4L7Y0_9SAUR